MSGDLCRILIVWENMRCQNNNVWRRCVHYSDRTTSRWQWGPHLQSEPADIGKRRLRYRDDRGWEVVVPGLWRRNVAPSRRKWPCYGRTKAARPSWLWQSSFDQSHTNCVIELNFKASEGNPRRNGQLRDGKWMDHETRPPRGPKLTRTLSGQAYYVLRGFPSPTAVLFKVGVAIPIRVKGNCSGVGKIQCIFKKLGT